MLPGWRFDGEAPSSETRFPWRSLGTPTCRSLWCGSAAFLGEVSSSSEEEECKCYMNSQSPLPARAPRISTLRFVGFGTAPDSLGAPQAKSPASASLCILELAGKGGLGFPTYLWLLGSALLPSWGIVHTAHFGFVVSLSNDCTQPELPWLLLTRK